MKYGESKCSFTGNSVLHWVIKHFNTFHIEALKFKIIIRIKVNLLSLRTNMPHCIVPSSGLFMKAVVSMRVSTHVPSGKPAVRHW